MTCLAFDGKELVADSQATSGDSMREDCVKIFKTDNYIMAFAGNLDDGYLFKAFLDDEIKSKDCSISKGFKAIVWLPDGSVSEYYNTLLPIESTNKYIVGGSGSPYAMAAMHCGKTAREAVEIAKKLDIYTGGKIISYSWDKIKKGKKKKNESVSTSNLQESVRKVPGAGESS